MPLDNQLIINITRCKPVVTERLTLEIIGDPLFIKSKLIVKLKGIFKLKRVKLYFQQTTITNNLKCTCIYRYRKNICLWIIKKKNEFKKKKKKFKKTKKKKLKKIIDLSDINWKIIYKEVVCFKISLLKDNKNRSFMTLQLLKCNNKIIKDKIVIQLKGDYNITLDDPTVLIMNPPIFKKHNSLIWIFRYPINIHTYTYK